jgi:F0F1-type ATP synthase delta subunit
MPTLYEQYAQALFETAQGAAKDEQRAAVDRLVAYLTERNELSLLAAIYERMVNLQHTKNAHDTVRIVSATPLDPKEQQAMRDAFPAPHHIFEESPHIIGGLVVQRDDEVYYASLHHALGGLNTAFGF